MESQGYESLECREMGLCPSLLERQETNTCLEAQKFKVKSYAPGFHGDGAQLLQRFPIVPEVMSLIPRTT